MLLSEKFVINLGSDLRWGEPTLSCLWPVTDVFRLKIHWAGVQLCFVLVR